jgi:site-specific DNA recombinase
VRVGRQGQGCGERRVRAGDLEDRIDAILRLAYGGSNIPLKVEVPADGHTAELEEVDRSLADLAADRYERGLFRGDDGTRRYTDMVTRLEAKREALAALRQRPARTDWEDGGPFAATWDSLDAAGRGKLMRQMGIRFSVAHGGADLRVTMRTAHRPVWPRTPEQRTQDQQADRPAE